MNTNAKILIVGAGAAGYSAACKLLENGFTNVRILEAENRIGGRVYSSPFGDGMIDYGAQWCHGEKDNIVYDLVKDLNLLQHSKVDYSQFTFIDSKGEFVDMNISNRLIQMLLAISDDYEQLKLQEGTFGEYVINRFEKELKSNYSDVDRTLAYRILDWFEKIQDNLISSPNWYDASAKGLATYINCEGSLALDWKDKGYITLFSILRKEMPDKSKKLPVDANILLNKEVVRIVWDNYEEKSFYGGVSVECSDGSKYNADHVIVTVSLGVLKETYKSMFVPELPLYKQIAIQGLAIGVVNKILLKFPRKWWPDDCMGFDLIWNEEDRRTLTAEFPEGPRKNGKSWLETIFGFHPIDNNPNVLLGWINGELIREYETLSDDVVQRGCMYLLQRFLGKRYNIPEPDAMIRSAWFTNRHFRGSYSYRSMKSDELQTEASDLAKPVGNNVLLFAGEATHSSYYSTVHGAVETGYREAQRIIDHYSLSSLSRTPSLKCKVAIIGAGVAGLGAALNLIQSGCTDILLIEAQDKPGGRIKTIPFNDSFIDLGAQWLHGNENQLWHISNEHKLISKRTVYEGVGLFLREDGFQFDEYLVKKVDFIIGRILEDCEQFVNASDCPESVGEYLEKKFSDFLKENAMSDEEIRLHLELYDWNVRFQIIDNCCNNLYELSAKYWGKYFCPAFEGQSYINYATGHGSVVEALLNQLPDNILVTNNPIVNIDWTMENGSVQLICQNSVPIETDAVIVTVSLGCLKNRCENFFVPDLPDELNEIIHDMGFAGICKIFLLFDTKWWDSDGFQLIWNFNHEYGDDWIRYLSGFDLVLDQPNMLMGWVGGRGAEIVERLPEKDIGHKCVEVLRQFTKNFQIPNPINVIRTSWLENPWIRGGYSYTTPKCDNHELLCEKLQEPLRDENGFARILFAGEHTSAEHFSTTHGAYATGLKQAQLLIDEGITK